MATMLQDSSFDITLSYLSTSTCVYFKSIQEHACAHHHSTQKYLVSERL